MNEDFRQGKSINLFKMDIESLSNFVPK